MQPVPPFYLLGIKQLQGLRAQHCLGLAGRFCAILKFNIKKSISLALLADVSNISFVKAENDTYVSNSSELRKDGGYIVGILKVPT